MTRENLPHPADVESCLQITGRVDVPLRDRIAAVLIEAAEFRGVYRLHNPDMMFLADAVIAALTSPIRGCTDTWHWSTGEPYRCPGCGYWMGEGWMIGDE